MIGATEACSSCAKPIGANVFSWVCVFHDPWEIGRETSQSLIVIIFFSLYGVLLLNFVLNFVLPTVKSVLDYISEC